MRPPTDIYMLSKAARFEALMTRLNPATCPKMLRQRCRTDLLRFAKTFLPSACPLPPSALHHYLIQRRQEKTARPLARRRGQLDVVLAPRGAAKSTWVSLVFPLHALLYELERYIVLISATTRQARLRLRALSSALANPGPLAAVYADKLQTLARVSAQSLELGDARIDAFGARSELRGIGHGSFRPSWIILDDAERGDRAADPDYRDALAQWFSEVIEPLGDASTHIDLIGTLLHPDALAARLAAHPDARARAFASIEREADRQDLWAAWRMRLLDRADSERAATARKFFVSNRNAMLKGTRVLWPQRESYYDLSLLRVTMGTAAFEKEKQNNPRAADPGIFRRASLRLFRLAGGAATAAEAPAGAGNPVASTETRLAADQRLILEPPRFDGLSGFLASASSDQSAARDPDAPPEVALADLIIYGFLDPALGGEAGDDSAVATVGRDRRGYCYVLDVWLERAAPSRQMERLFDLHARWRYTAFGIETNAFQRLLMGPLEAERQRRRTRRAPWDLPVHQCRHRAPKADRILALEPHARNGWLLFNEELPEAFWRQLEDFPAGRRDDGPDALAAAFALARDAAHPVPKPQTRPRRSRRGTRAY